jgi:hypothetical protein
VADMNKYCWGGLAFVLTLYFMLRLLGVWPT